MEFVAFNFFTTLIVLVLIINDIKARVNTYKYYKRIFSYLCKNKNWYMNKKLLPNYIFEVSWEVCNKVGGIYTVLSSCAKTLSKNFGDQVIFIGPDNQAQKTDFTEDTSLDSEWSKIKELLPVRIGRWNIPGSPRVILTQYSYLEPQKNEFYTQAWNLYKVDSLHAYGDYDESSLFSLAAAKVAECVYKNILYKHSIKNIIYQAHEWMSGLGMLYIKHHLPQIATIFTTHATSIGRSIVSNNKLLYKYMDGYNGDQMAEELNMQSKHSIEKRSAFEADCFTTVSQITSKECLSLLDKEADVILPNGFEADFVPKGIVKNRKRENARKRIFDVLNALTGQPINKDAFIVSTSGRNDYKCKGYDVFIETAAKLQQETTINRDILILIEVPCWTKEPRKDLIERLQKSDFEYHDPLPQPYITHWLYNMSEDRILSTMLNHGIDNNHSNQVRILFIPCYLDGNDGIFNITYYDFLTACDLCVYPSYYEPWGYTPLESVAFGIPTITTNLTGFGLWIKEQGLGNSILEGIQVVDRNDDNYFETIENIKSSIIKASTISQESFKETHTRLTSIASQASWKKFFKYYIKAYELALHKCELRNKQVTPSL